MMDGVVVVLHGLEAGECDSHLGFVVGVLVGIWSVEV